MELHKRIVKSKIFIDRHYSTSIDLDMLCAEACISKFHFIRIFKKTYNRTPHQYITQKRLEKSCLLLRKNKYSINEVCQRVGFESQQTFTTKFRMHTGYTPTQYRKMAQQQFLIIKNTPARVIPFCYLSKFGPEGILAEIEVTYNSNFE